MLQKVLKVGSSAAITIPKKSLEGLGMAIGENVHVVVNEQEGMVTIRPQRSLDVPNAKKRHEQIAKLTLNFIDRYRKDLEALAKG